MTLNDLNIGDKFILKGQTQIKSIIDLANFIDEETGDVETLCEVQNYNGKIEYLSFETEVKKKS